MLRSAPPWSSAWRCSVKTRRPVDRSKAIRMRRTKCTPGLTKWRTSSSIRDVRFVRWQPSTNAVHERREHARTAALVTGRARVWRRAHVPSGWGASASVMLVPKTGSTMLSARSTTNPEALAAAPCTADGRDPAEFARAKPCSTPRSASLKAAAIGPSGDLSERSFQIEALSLVIRIIVEIGRLPGIIF